MSEARKNEESLLGIDYGSANIGLAFGSVGLVLPLRVVSGKNEASAVTEISRVIVENKIDKVVIGLPLTLNGKDTSVSGNVRRFSKLLKTRVGIPVEFVNEYGTTIGSIEAAVEMGVPQKKRREIDHLSASLILKRYYSERES